MRIVKLLGQLVHFVNAHSCLLWADDILMLSKSEAGLQEKLNNLEAYCDSNKLSVNNKKTQCMIFSKTGRLIRKQRFTYKGSLLDNVREYKYLGFLVTPSGETRSGLEDLRRRALKALAKMKSTLGAHFRHNIGNTLHLYNYLIRPILTYCSDYWGCIQPTSNNPIEKLHMSFCKQLLGVRKQTTTDGVLLELGMTPISFYAIKAAVKNWERILRNKANRLLIASVNYATKENLLWTSNIRKIFCTNGLLQAYLSKLNESEDTKKGPINNMLHQRLCDQFNQTSLETVKTSSKMKTLNLLKQEHGRESYLDEIPNSKHRNAMTKLRLSAHSLAIETGRYNQTKPEDRIC